MSRKNEFQMPLYATIELAVAMVENSGDFADLDNIDSADINVVHNTDSQVALVLPYYSSLADIASSEALADEDMGDASGGQSLGDFLRENSTRIFERFPEGGVMHTHVSNLLRDLDED